MNVSAAGISQMQQSQVMHEVGVAVAKKTLDASKQQGAAALSLLADNVAMSKTAASEPGKGLKIDVHG